MQGIVLKGARNKTWIFRFYVKGYKKISRCNVPKNMLSFNYASSNFKLDLNKSYKALTVGIHLAQKAQFIDLEVWLSNNQIICNLTKKDFSEETCLKKL